MKSSTGTKKTTPSPVKRKSTTATTQHVKKVAHKASSSVVKRIKKQSRQTLRHILLSHLFQQSVKVTMVSLIVASSGYGVYHLIETTFANEVVISKSEIVARVSKLTTVPEGEPSDVVRVEDKDTLKKQNPFYEDVKEGDYIVIYKDAAIIYDLRNNSIVAVRKTQTPETEGVAAVEQQVLGTTTKSVETTISSPSSQ